MIRVACKARPVLKKFQSPLYRVTLLRQVEGKYDPNVVAIGATPGQNVVLKLGRCL